MSRLRFPRVAPRTRPRLPATPALKPLLVGIYRDGELVRTEEIPDPRIGFVKAFNSHSTWTGLSASVIAEGGGE